MEIAMPKTTVTKPPASAAVLQESVQQTMHRMAGHFAATGTFRGQDVARVIGNPAETITQVAKPDMAPRPQTSNLLWLSLEGVRS